MDASKGPHQRRIKLYIYDFTSYANNSKHCLTAEESPTPAVCSTAWKFNTLYMFNFTERLSFKVAAEQRVPGAALRFWFGIECRYFLLVYQCTATLCSFLAFTK